MGGGHRRSAGRLWFQVLGDFAEALFVFVIADDEKGVDDTGQPSEEGEDDAEKKTAQAASQKHREWR